MTSEEGRGGGAGKVSVSGGASLADSWETGRPATWGKFWLAPGGAAVLVLAAAVAPLP